MKFCSILPLILFYIGDAIAVLDCSPSSTTGITPDCWKQLNVSQYIQDWVRVNYTTANCGKLGFAQCYLQLNGYGGRTCDLLTRGTCDSFETSVAASATYQSNQQFYTLWNIYAIYQYFNQFSEALWNGHALAADNIQQIVATVSPSTDPQVPNTLLLTSISGGWWLVAVAAAADPILALAATGMAVVMGMSSSFMTSVSGSSDARFTTLGTVSSGLADLIVGYQASIEHALTEIQGNSTLFLAATSPGGFSSRVVTSLNLESNDLYHDLQLFVLSQAFQANGIVATRSTGVNALDFIPTLHTDLTCTGLGPAGNCFQWWIDPDTKNTYALHDPNNWQNNHVDMMNTITSKGWATLSEIFKLEGCAGGKPSFDGKKVSCLATHGLCEWAYQEDIVALRTANKQFNDCNNDKAWGSLCSSFDGGVAVPQAYLGPVLHYSNDWCRLADQ